MLFICIMLILVYGRNYQCLAQAIEIKHYLQPIIRFLDILSTIRFAAILMDYLLIL